MKSEEQDMSALNDGLYVRMHDNVFTVKECFWGILD